MLYNRFIRCAAHLSVSPENRSGKANVAIDFVANFDKYKFVNGTVVTKPDETIIPDNSRVALFGAGMRLLCGGQHLKGHGYVEEPAPDINYF